MNKCILVPEIKKDSIEYPSRLFLDLLSMFDNNRNLVVPIYVAATQMKDLFEYSDIDNLGEPKIDSVVKMFNLLEKNGNDFSQESLEKYLNAKSDGKQIYYNTFNNAFEQINAFNKKTNNKIGVVKFEKGKGYYISIENLDVNNSDTFDTQRVVYELNPKFKALLNSYGFDVSRVNDLEDKGVFSPENAEKNANGFIDIIKLSKGLEGDYAFSEEFCHFVIAGLKNNPLVQRMFGVINIDVAKEILGDKFDIYKQKYENTGSQEEINNLLREEALGKLLAENIILMNKQNVVNPTLFNRFKNAIISFFKDKNEKEIEDIINESKKTLNDITYKIQTLDKDFFENFSKNDVLKSKNLYKVNNEIKSEVEKISKRILELSMKEEKIARIKAPGSTVEERKEFIEKKKTNLANVKGYFNSGEHTKNCIYFLQNTTTELIDLMKTIESTQDELKNKSHNETIKFGRCCYLLNTIRDFSSTYREEITNLLTINDPNLSTQDQKLIHDLSEGVLRIITELDKSYIKARFDIIKAWLETYYWKNNIKTGKFNDKGEEIYLTLESLLREAPKDINNVDLYLAEMGHCSDVMLNLISTIHKKQMTRRDQKLEDIYLRANNIHKDLNEDTEFMYERKDGKLTGRLISEIDFDAFELAKDKFKKEIEEDITLDDEGKEAALDEWYLDNTEEVVVDKTNNRKERLPIVSKYYKTEWDAGLSTTQKKYYREMIQLKAEMETLLGPTNYHVYDAPQMSSDYIQKISDSSSIGDKIKFAFSELKHQIVRESDDIEFGEYEAEDDGIVNVTLDMRKNPIKKIPVFFVHKLKDMNRLNTDFTKAICAYSAMAVNYNEMSAIINQIETFKDLLLDREVAQYSGDSLMMNIIKDGQNVLKEVFGKKGELTNIGERLQKYIDMNFYGMQKADEGYVKVGDTKVDVAKTVDNVVKGYSGLVNLGVNPFSGFSNISMGEVQMIIEAMANTGMSLLGGEKDTFGLRDWLWAHKEYAASLPKIIIESESLNKTSKVALLMRKFDTEQNFYDKLKSSGFYSNAAKRFLGNNTIAYIMQNCGEHYLHTNLMLAMLHSKKVLLNGKEVSLFDAYEVKDNKIVEKGEIKELDGSKFTNDKFIDFKLKIQELSHQFNGAFSAEDLGTLQQKSWGRLLMQFRQWMPGHWGRRFAKKYYNTATKQYQEGYWQTVYRILWKELAMSVIKTKRSIPEYWGSLSNYEKTNLMKAGIETMLILALSLLIRAMFSDDDDDEKKSRLKQFMKYQAKRTYMEMVATCPIMLNQMVKNTLTMLQSPAAAIKSFDNIWNLIRLDHLFDEIESGTYQGMSVYWRDFLKALPYYGQIRKYWDLATEDYMFNLFKDK